MQKRENKTLNESKTRKESKLKAKKENLILSKIKVKFYQHKKNRKLVETTISIRTKYLSKEVKTLCDFNFKVALLALLGATLTSITTLKDDGAEIIDYFLKDDKADFPYLNFVLCLIALFVIILSIYSFFKQFNTYNPTHFVNNIVSEQYDTEDFTAIFIIKAMFDNIPKLLVFRSESWNSYFLPYCHFDERLSNNEIIEKIKLPLAEQLEVELSDFSVYDDFSKNDYVAIKKNPSQNSISKINYRFYYVKFNNPYLARKFLNSNLQHFTWKSKYELGKDMNTKLNNGDVVSIIDELSLINQSQVAFQAHPLNSFEINSRYNIIWNITNKCHFDCPICATNSGSNYKCQTTYANKINILLNLSSINGYISQLDISGGDPLINSNDRELIRKANKILAYTDIRVTTTGRALEKLSVNELTDTVKKCDITYDIPYEVCNDKLREYRDYYYNYYNFRQLERFSNSGVKIELNIHVPILPATIDKKLIEMILDDLNKINPSEVKLIRLMPVGRMQNKEPLDDYSPQEFIDIVNEEMNSKGYKFNITYNCSLGCKVKSIKSNTTNKTCGMLTRKLGIDHLGHVYSCIWGAYIEEFQGDKYINNPFYLGDLTKNTMYEILTKPSTLKKLKELENKADGCRVCAYVNSKNDEKYNNLSPNQIMLTAEDTMRGVQIN